MGLRILSLGSVLADSVSVFHLFTQGLSSTSSTVPGLVWVVGAVLPSASLLAIHLLRRLQRPSLEIAHQLAFLDLRSGR